MPLFLKKEAFRDLASIFLGTSGTCGGPGDPGVSADAHKDARKVKEVRIDVRSRTQDEARAKRKAYRKRKAAKAARRRNRR